MSGSPQRSQMPLKRNLNQWSGIMRMSLNRLNTTDWHPELFPMMSWTGSSTMLRQSPRRRTSSHSSPLLPTSFKLSSHTCTRQQQMNLPSFSNIPMVANSNLLNLYEFLPLLIHFDFAANISIAPDVGQTNLLAIGQSQSFQAICSTDLQTYLHLGGTFFCKGRKVMETNLKRSCLGALYMANFNSIQNHCRFKIAEAREKIFEFSENTWAVYSIGTIITNEVCPAANDVTAMQIQSGDTIKIRPGCYVWTMDHVISADESETIETIKTMDWAGKITDLLHYENKDAIHQAVQGLPNRYNGEFDATVLLDLLDQLDQRGQTKAPDAHWLIGCHLPIRIRLLFLEMLLPDGNNDNCDPTFTLCSTNANAGSPSPASRTCLKDPEPQTKE